MNADLPHPSPAELSGYAAHRLAAADVLRISDHLAACAVCHELLATLRPPPPARRLGDFLTDPPAGIPGFDELAGEVDGTLDPAARAELADTLTGSPAAGAAVADLAAFRAELAALPPKHHRPENATAALPALPPAANVITPSPGRWRQAAGWTARLAALLAVLAVGSWVFARSGRGSAGLLRTADGRSAPLGGLPADLRAAVELAARTGQLPPLTPLPATGRETLAGRAAEVRLTALSPVGAIVREQRPPLQWTSLPDATGYVVSVLAADDGPLVTSPVLPATQTQWTPPTALARGRTYQWQVEALRGDAVIDRAPKPPAGEARFQVLAGPANSGLEEVEALDSAFPLVLGVAYWRAGLPAAAADQFHRLTQAHATSAVARRLELAAAPAAGVPVNPAPPK